MTVLTVARIGNTGLGKEPAQIEHIADYRSTGGDNKKMKKCAQMAQATPAKLSWASNTNSEFVTPE